MSESVSVVAVFTGPPRQATEVAAQTVVRMAGTT